MVQFLEMIGVEVVEEPLGAGRMPGDVQIMNMRVPILADILDTRHITHYIWNPPSAADAPRSRRKCNHEETRRREDRTKKGLLRELRGFVAGNVASGNPAAESRGTPGRLI